MPGEKPPAKPPQLPQKSELKVSSDKEQREAKKGKIVPLGSVEVREFLKGHEDLQDELFGHVLVPIELQEQELTVEQVLKTMEAMGLRPATHEDFRRQAWSKSPWDPSYRFLAVKK